MAAITSRIVSLMFALYLGVISTDLERRQDVCELANGNNASRRIVYNTDKNINVGPDFEILTLKRYRTLETIVFEDGVYDCTEDWLDTLEYLYHRNVGVVHAGSDTKCKHVTEYCEKYANFISQMYCQRRLHAYSEAIAPCTFNFLASANVISCPTRNLTRLTIPHDILVNCHNLNLTSATVPLSYPPQTTRLHLGMNQISDIAKLMDVVHAMVNLSFLQLSHNQIYEFPRLPESTGHMKKLKALNLDNNKITKIDLDVLRSYTNYPDLKVHFHDNRLQCDCDTQEFMTFLKYNWKTFEELDRVYCTYDDKLVRPWTMDNSRCKTVFRLRWTPLDYAIVFAACVNILVVYIFVDMYWVLRTFQQGKQTDAIPVIHRIMSLFSVSLYGQRSQKRNTANKSSLIRYDQQERLASLHGYFRGKHNGE